MGVENPKWWAPQIITASRPVMTGLGLFNWFNGNPELGLQFFTAAAATDVVDGPVARALKVDSQQGDEFELACDGFLLLSLLYTEGSLDMKSSIIKTMIVMSSLLLSHLVARGTVRGQVAETIECFKRENAKTIFGVYIGLILLNLALNTDDPLRGIASVAVIGGIGLLAREGIEKFWAEK